MIRLIWTDFYRLTLEVPVRERAFLPRLNDPEGISVYRLACVSDAKDVLVVMAPDKRASYGMALFPVSELTALKLTVKPDPIDAVPGHAIIPEMHYSFAESSSLECLELQKDLAKIAAKNVIPPQNKTKT